MISKKFKLFKKYDIETGIEIDTNSFVLIPTIIIKTLTEFYEIEFVFSFLFFSFRISIDKYDYEYDKDKYDRDYNKAKGGKQ